MKNITFPGRHLGLVPPQEHSAAEEAIGKAAEVMSRYLDTKQLWDIAHHATPLDIVFRNTLFLQQRRYYRCYP